MRLAVAAALVLLALAGCAQEEDDGSPGPATPTATQSSSSTTSPPPAPAPPILQLLAFDLTGCDGISLRHARPLDDVQALLPDGFTAAPAPGGPGDAAGVLAVDLFACGNLTTATAAVASTYVGLVYTYVERPAERVPVAPDVPVHEYVFRMLAAEDVLAVLWKAALYDTYNGTAALDLGQPGPARVAQASVGDGYAWQAAGTALDVGGGRDQAFARYTVVEADASVLLWVGTYDLPAAAAGPGVVLVADADPFAALVPTRRLAGTAVLVEDGNVRGSVLSRVFT